MPPPLSPGQSWGTGLQAAIEVEGALEHFSNASVIESIVGVKQGDLLGPPLFDLYIAAIMETWRVTSTYELPLFRTRPDFQMADSLPSPSTVGYG